MSVRQIGSAEIDEWGIRQAAVDFCCIIFVCGAGRIINSIFIVQIISHRVNSYEKNNAFDMCTMSHVY